ncbi:MAG TPA: AsmA family protein [Burkholderiales bacterium]|nr:AsmA family protein [Burkholderiales bacterium]
MKTRRMQRAISRPLGLALGAAAALLLAVFGVVLWIESESGQRFIERRASAASGREISIGDLDLKFGFRPGIRVSDLRVTNPDWAKTSHLVDAKLIDARFRILPLLKGIVYAHELTLVQGKVGLEREKNRNTWTFKTSEEPQEDKPLPFIVRRINVDRGFVVFRDTTIDTQLEIDVGGDVSQGGQGAVDMQARGTFRGQKTRGVARFPGLLPTPDTAVEMSAAVALGDITAAFAGTLRAANVDGIDIDLDVSGASLADLKKLAPLNLPNTPPYRLQGRFRNPSEAFVFEPFAGRVGDSDLSGSASYSRGGKRPVLKANLVSTLLDLDDLGPLAGAPPKTGAGETAAPRQKQQAQQIDVTGKILPQKRFAIADWPIMDADVDFKGKKIVDAGKVPIHDLSARWIMEAGVLRFEPLRFRMADGTVNANIRLDSNQKPLAGKINMDVSALNLRKLFPGEGRMKDPLGNLYGRIDISGHGTSVADLFGTSNGRLALLVNGGQISNLLMEAVGLDLAEALRILATKDQNVQLRCAVVDLSIKTGVATPQVFVIDTTDTVVTGSGTLDFRSETLKLTTRAEPKDTSPFVLRTPINVTGTFKDPDVMPQIGPLAARAGAGLLLGAIHPLLAVIPFIETGPGEDTDCGQLMKRVKSEGVKAPAKPTAASTAELKK